MFLDCDGVIFDVNGAKTAAFVEVLADAPAAAVGDFLAHHRANGGGSRYAKFRRFYSDVAPNADVEGAVADACARFSRIVERVYDQLAPHPEAVAFARHAHAPVVVVSGSDQRELRGVFQRQHLEDCFPEILGSPDTKVEHISRWCQAHNVAPGQCVLIGDGGGDASAARDVGMPFVFLQEMSEWDGAEEEWRRAGFWWARSWADVRMERYRERT